MFLFHRHKFGKVEKDGFQYCTKCGKAVAPEPPQCDHNFRIVKEIMIDGAILQKPEIQYILSCKKCGEMEAFKLSPSGSYPCEMYWRWDKDKDSLLSND